MKNVERRYSNGGDGFEVVNVANEAETFSGWVSAEKGTSKDAAVWAASPLE
ncbi:hypothetical protein [Paenibacillus pinihumi]|uniref:hypothetical protein n=1 Tax=Paenibacillus pinihumi TaxID=669462 RepID=UPI0003FA238B|nr:hypothetical protein [Paenibacillus pinihumi]